MWNTSFWHEGLRGVNQKIRAATIIGPVLGRTEVFQIEGFSSPLLSCTLHFFLCVCSNLSCKPEKRFASHLLETLATQVSVIWNRWEGHFLFHSSYMKLTLYLNISRQFNLKKHAVKFQEGKLRSRRFNLDHQRHLYHWWPLDHRSKSMNPGEFS